MKEVIKRNSALHLSHAMGDVYRPQYQSGFHRFVAFVSSFT